MIVGLDSSFDRPTPAIAQQALAAGVQMWGGYLATNPDVHLASPWDQASFDVVKVLPATPLAFCSGLDDPVACAQLAAQWGVRLCLDVESGIRPDGPWVQAWLDASGAGLYGVASVHTGRRAAFHVLADYPGSDPGATWSGACPGPHCGWQWEGSHVEFGLSVDRGWYDDWFALASTPPTSPSWEVESVKFDGNWNGAQNLFRIEPNGNLVHSWTVGNGVWNQEVLGVGYVQGVLELGHTPGQIHVFSLQPSGGAAHFWQDQNTPNWNVETIVPA